MIAASPLLFDVSRHDPVFRISVPAIGQVDFITVRSNQKDSRKEVSLEVFGLLTMNLRLLNGRSL